MSSPPDPPPEWPPPGEVVALEPDTIPNHPLRAEDCQALLPKEIG
jgi:hypothetical protein